MLKHGQVIPMISSSLGYRSGFNFHHQWIYDATLSFMPGKQHFTWEKSAFNISRLQYGTQFPCFWIIPNDFKRYEIVCWVTPNVSVSSFCVWHESSSNKIPRLRTLSAFRYVLCLRRQIPFLNFWNRSRQLLSLKAASLHASTRFISLSCRFLQIEKVNQKFLQMTLIRLKTRHFRQKNKKKYMMLIQNR